MIPYQTKSDKLAGTSLKEVKKSAMMVYKEIVKLTKGEPYIRSAYFRKRRKEKVFLNYFWNHLSQKSPKQRFKRLKYFKAAIDLIKNSRNKPISKLNPNNKNEVLHRFAGLTKNKELFYVQIKEETKKGKKYFMSCFPPE